MRDCSVDVAERDERARQVLLHDVGQDVELCGLLRDLERRLELPLLEMREVELAQQHRVHGAIDAVARGEPSAGPDAA